MFQPIVYNWLSFKNKLADKLWLACSVSIAAQVITFPLSAYYFHQFPVYFLVSNLLIAVPVIIIMYCGLLLLALPQLPYVSKALGFMLEHTIIIMNKGLAVIEHSPYAAINKIWPSRIECLLLFIIITVAFYFFYAKQKRFIAIALGCILLFSISIGLKKINADNTRSVAFLNLRKHTGIVIKNGNKGVVLTDLPENDKNFKYAVQPYLDSSRITDYQVHPLTAEINTPYLIKHGNLIGLPNNKLLLLNHAGNMTSITRELNINYLYVNDDSFLNIDTITGETVIIGSNNSDKYIRNLITVINAKGLKYYNLKRNKSLILLSN